MNLSVEDITVEVPGTERVVLSGISFKLSAGTGLALLGASAAGKSSLVRALVGVWPVTKGAIRLDGAALDNWHPDGLGRHIGYLPQDVALFDGTVAENIARFDATATSDAVLDAARLAGAHEMILSLPDGYTTNSVSAAQHFQPDSVNASDWLARCSGTPFLSFLTNQTPISITTAKWR